MTAQCHVIKRPCEDACGTSARRLRRSNSPMLQMSTPSMMMLPALGSMTLKRDIISVLLPQPVLPAMPTCGGRPLQVIC